ncbi:MAG: putative RND superfamily exporter protein [Bacteriovoracaceae bacterium]|jgi:predicted RND superfamily exporter protein
MYSFKKSICIISTIIILAGYFLSQLNISNTPSTYIPPNLESFKLNDKILSEFNNDDTMVFLFKLQKSIDHKTFLEKLNNFTSGVEELDGITKVQSVFSYESIRSVDGGFETIKIINSDEISDFNFDQTLKLVGTDKFVKDLFVNKDLSVFGVLIEPEDIKDSIVRLKLEAEVFELLKTSDVNRFKIAYGGEFSVDTAQYRELNSMMAFVVPITFIVGCALLLFLFQSGTAVFIGTVFNGLIAVIVLSLFGLFGWPYNMLAAMIPTLMMALCIAFIVHLYNGILLEIEAGKEIKTAIINSVKKIKKASFFSALTTAAGMFSLSVSDIPPIRSVGVIGGIGVLIIFFFVLYLLPPVLIKFDKGNWKQNKHFRRILDTVVSKLVNVSMNSPGKILLVFLFLTITLSGFIFRVESESNIRKFFHPEHEVNVSSEVIKKEFVGTTVINLLFTNSNKSLVTTKFNNRIESVKEEFLKIPNLARVFSATDIIKQMNWAFNEEQENFFSIPSSDELIEQYLLVYDGEDIFDFLSNDHKRFKMSVNLNVHGANEIEEVLIKMEKVLIENGFNKYDVGMAGSGKLFSDQENLIMKDLLTSVSLSIIVIFVIMLFLWRSFSSAFYCMLPNISPVLAMFITMGVFGIWLDIGTAMIASVTVGIAVDDTIHIFQGFLNNFKEKKLELKEALTNTYNESGRAIIITTIILAAQFAVLMVTDFYPMRNFGMLTTIGIIVALLFDLFVLPALIVITFKPKSL